MSPRRSTLSLNQKLTLIIGLLAILSAIIVAFISGHDWFSTAPIPTVSFTPTYGLTPTPVYISIKVFSAKYPFASTGITVNKGDEVTVTATGEWDCGRGSSVGPEGYVAEQYSTHVFPNAPACALIAAITSVQPTENFDQYILVGAKRTWTAQETGKLYLGCNDEIKSIRNNPTNSELEVKITVEKQTNP